MSPHRKLTLRNYRCFDWDNPAELIFCDGFTAIVGPNNSGKSSALRSVYELRYCFSQCRNALLQSNGYHVQSNFFGVLDPSELANDKDAKRFEVEIEIPYMGEAIELGRYIATRVVLEFDVFKNIFFAKKIYVSNQLVHEKILNEMEIRGGTTQSESLIFYSGNRDEKFVDFSEIFAFLGDLSESRYFPAFRNAINEGAGTYYDVPIGTSLVQSWDMWKAGTSKAQKIAIGRVENEIAELLGFKSLQINADQSGKTLDITINGKPHKLYEVGAGVAQLIIVLAAALVYRPTYVLIDEPELSLHPSLQLNFLATLSSYASKGLLYSTHSIGLARCTAQRILITSRLSNGSSKMEPLGDRKRNYVEMLGELSYSGRVDLGCEGLLLVEGPTDVLFFQEFLRKLGKDGKYVVMQLGGSSLINANIGTHIAEVIRIIDPSNINIFIDSEKISAEAPLNADRQAFLHECKELGVNAVASERRATENYLEIKGIQAVLGEEYEPLDHFQLLKTAKKPWNKSLNWKIARESAFEDIEDTDFGQFLKSL